MIEVGAYLTVFCTHSLLSSDICLGEKVALPGMFGGVGSLGLWAVCKNICTDVTVCLLTYTSMPYNAFTFTGNLSFTSLSMFGMLLILDLHSFIHYSLSLLITSWKGSCYKILLEKQNIAIYTVFIKVIKVSQ